MISTVSVPGVVLLDGLDSLLVAAGVGPFLLPRKGARFVALLAGFDALASAAGALVPGIGGHEAPYRLLLVVYLAAVGLVVVTRRRVLAALPLAVLAAVLAVDNLSAGLPGVPAGAVPAVAMLAGCWSAACGGAGLVLASRARVAVGTGVTRSGRPAAVLGVAALAAGAACLALG